MIFGEKSAKITVFSDENLSKLTIVHGLKIKNINKTPGFYSRGYGTKTDFSFPLLLATFEPLEIYKSYIPFWTAQECGNNA